VLQTIVLPFPNSLFQMFEKPCLSFSQTHDLQHHQNFKLSEINLP
jgi:hypothetical protein